MALDNSRTLQKAVREQLDAFERALEVADSWEDYNLRLGRLLGARLMWRLVCEEAGL